MSEAGGVWITGVGAATPLGHEYRTIAENLLAGRSGVQAVRRFDVKEQPSQIAGLIQEIPTPPGMAEAEFTSLGAWEQLFLWSASRALVDSGLWDQRSRLRVGVIVGIGAEWILTWESAMRAGQDRIRDPASDGKSLMDRLRDRLELRGRWATVAAACASANVAISLGRRWVERGWVDICLAGGCDRSVTPMGMAGFGNLGALSKRNDQPTAASRPFDRGRDGFVMGEAGAILVLERAATARHRGAHVYGEIVGYGSSSDAHHLVIPSPDTSHCVRAVRAAIRDARINVDDIDYVNAHGTSTPVGDAFESRVLQEVLGGAIGRVPVSSTKSMTGHLLGATAAVEAIACLAAFEHGALPPTINLDDPDPECDLLHVAGSAREADVRVAVSNSFGFGGSNTCLVLRKVA